MTPTRWLAVSTLCMCLASGLPAGAQIPLGPEFRVDNTLRSGYGWITTSTRRVSMAPDGRFVVVWEVGEASEQIAMRRFSASGRPLASEGLVNSYTSSFQMRASVGMDDTGQFVVSWAGNGEAMAGAWGQRFDAAGTPSGANFLVSADIGFPLASMAPGGESAIVGKSGSGVAARLYDASGAPVGTEFQVNSYSPSHGAWDPSVGFDAAGDFVVVWGIEDSIRGRLFAASGAPQGAEFVFPTAGELPFPRVARARDGSFVIAWIPAFGTSVFAQRFDSSATPVGSTFVVASVPYLTHEASDVAIDAEGGFVVVWGSAGYVRGRRFDPVGVAGPEFTINGAQDGELPSVAIDPAGNFVVTWYRATWATGEQDQVVVRRYAGGLMAAASTVDASPGPASDGNGVLEAGETVTVAPFWLNGSFGARTFAGTASSFTGPGTPGDPVYAITDATADYGTVPSNGGASCASTGDCYELGVTVPSVRPAAHWDTTFVEDIATPNVAPKRWTSHVGDSFADVPRSHAYYRFVETLLHSGVTGGCTANAYCPASPTTREQMAVFVLVANEGAGYVPPACATSPFDDVPAGSPFCPWIKELARRGVVAGCDSTHYCPTAPVSREEMAVFVLATKEPGFRPFTCSIPMFIDVPASSPFCPWIEELARRGVVTGCGGGAYCPTSPVTREQMSVFLTGTFGLLLYGP